MNKIFFFILGILLISSISALQINNVLVEDSIGEKIYFNSTYIDNLKISNDSIEVYTATNTSVFTTASNIIFKIRDLNSPYNNVFFDYANTIIGTSDENLNLTTGIKVIIFPVSENIQTIINNYYGGGGGTSIIEKVFGLPDEQIKNIRIWIFIFTGFFLLVILFIFDILRRKKIIKPITEIITVGLTILISSALIISTYKIF